MKILTLSLLLTGASALASPYVLWYDKPAAPGMNEALPIGGGKFGGLIYGAPDRERIVLNEISLWTGTELSSDDYDKMGSYQMLGELLVETGATPATGAEDYRRELDLGTAVHNISYKINGVTYRREAFASHASGIMALRLWASVPGACSGTVRLKGAHEEKTQAANNALVFAGALSNGLKYETKLIALHDGGTLRAGEGTLEFQDCNSVTLLLAAGMDYVMDYSRKYRGENPHGAIEQQLTAAAKKSYDALKSAHVADFQSLFNRVALDVGASSADRLALPMNQRKVMHADKGGDPDLEETLFQYGRYLMISCSRPGGLPANLQGLWCDSNNPP